MIKANNENETAYLKFFETLSSGDLEKIRATFHDDAVWQATSSSPGWTLEVGGEGRNRSEGFGFGNLFEPGEQGGDAAL